MVYIQAHALQADRSYEFKVVLTNSYDTTLQYTGYALVIIQEDDSILVSVK